MNGDETMLNTKIIEEAEDQFGLESSLSLLHYLTKQQYMEMYYDNLYTESDTENADDGSEDVNDPNRKGSNVQSDTPKPANKQPDVVDSNRHNRKPQDPTNKMNPKSQPASASGQMDPSKQPEEQQSQTPTDQQPPNDNEQQQDQPQQQSLGSKITSVIAKIWSFISGIFQKLTTNIRNFLKGNDQRVQESQEQSPPQPTEYKFELDGNIENGPPISFEGGEQSQGNDQTTSQPDTFDQSTGDNNSERSLPPTEADTSANVEKTSHALEEMEQRMAEMEKRFQELEEENKRLKEIDEESDNDSDDEVDEQEIAENEQKTNWLSQLLDRITAVKDKLSQTNQAPIGDGNTVTLTQDQFERIIQSITSSQSQQAPPIQDQPQQVPQQPLPSGQNAMTSLMSALGIGAGSSGDMSQSSIITAGQNNDLIVRINELEEQLRRSQELTDQMQRELQQQREQQQQQQQQQQQGGNNDNQSQGGVQQLAQTLGVPQQQTNSGTGQPTGNDVANYQTTATNLINDNINQYNSDLNNLDEKINDLIRSLVNGGSHGSNDISAEINQCEGLVSQLRSFEAEYRRLIGTTGTDLTAMPSWLDSATLQTIEKQQVDINKKIQEIHDRSHRYLETLKNHTDLVNAALNTAPDKISKFDELKIRCTKLVDDNINSPTVDDATKTKLTDLKKRFEPTSELSQHVETLKTAINNPDGIRQNLRQNLERFQSTVDHIDNTELSSNLLTGDSTSKIATGGRIRYDDIPVYYKQKYPAVFSIDQMTGTVYVKVTGYLMPNIAGGSGIPASDFFTKPIEDFLKSFCDYLDICIALEKDINARLTAIKGDNNQGRFTAAGQIGQFTAAGCNTTDMMEPGGSGGVSGRDWNNCATNLSTTAAVNSTTDPVPFKGTPIQTAFDNTSWMTVDAPTLRTELNKILEHLDRELTPKIDDRVKEINRRMDENDLKGVNDGILRNGSSLQRKYRDTDNHRSLHKHIQQVSGYDSQVITPASNFMNSYLINYINRICSIGEICNKCLGGSTSTGHQFGRVGTSALATRANDYLHHTGQFSTPLAPSLSDDQIKTQRTDDINQMVNVIRP